MAMPVLRREARRFAPLISSDSINVDLNLENACSEQGARMSAMDSSNRNAGKMLNRLTLTYNRTQQASITTEMIKIISRASALEG